MCISKNIFLLLLLLPGLSVCLVWLSLSCSGPSVYCFSVCQGFIFLFGVSVRLVYPISLVCLSLSVCLSVLSIFLSCLFVSLFSLSFFLSVGLGHLSFCSVCLFRSVWSFFLSCLSFCWPSMVVLSVCLSGLLVYCLSFFQSLQMDWQTRKTNRTDRETDRPDRETDHTDRLDRQKDRTDKVLTEQTYRQTDRPDIQTNRQDRLKDRTNGQRDIRKKQTRQTRYINK